MYENMSKDDWMMRFYTEVERLFDGLLPRTFNINMIDFPEKDMGGCPEEAAKDYFVGYCDNYCHARG